MYRIAIDRGGTFTDVFAVCPNNKRVLTLKLLSQDPSHYNDAPFEAIRRIVTAPDSGVSGSFNDCLASIRMGTTVATNALLEHKGERMAIVLTKGFRDAFKIGTQNRENIFELNLSDPFVLYERVVEVDERVILEQESCQLASTLSGELVEGISGDRVRVVGPLDRAKVRVQLQEIYDTGIRCLAVAFIHSYTFDRHERIVEELAKDIGFEHVTLSSHLMPMIRYIPRGMTSITDAYLTPHIQRYIASFLANFDADFDSRKLLFMQSDGGLTTVDRFSGSRSILSGPAGGVIGYALTTCSDIGKNQPIIGFDMGGTSTDVSRFDGQFEHVFESKIAGVVIQSPQLDIQTVAAGGGSRLYFRNGLFVVGPESSGSFPGPVCYRNPGGLLSVTDANLALGRLVPELFPKIFGPNKDLALDKAAVQAEFERLTVEINEFCVQNGRAPMSVEEVALGFVKVANEAMCRPIRAITQGKGHDVSRHILTCFGGAGGQHACAIARTLGISRVFIHKYAGILSAYGIALSDIVHEETLPCSTEYSREFFEALNNKADTLVKKCVDSLKAKEFGEENIKVQVYLNLRYERTDFGLMISLQDSGPVMVKNLGFRLDEDNYKERFARRYKQEFGFCLPDRTIVIDDIRVRAAGCVEEFFSNTSAQESCEPAQESPKPLMETQVYFEQVGLFKTLVYRFDELAYGHQIQGPAIIIEKNSTILVEPFCTARVTAQQNILIDVQHGLEMKLGTELDPIYLAIFGHLFMSIAEQMGCVLRHTAISTNIKERLDFSCAIFGPQGHLVSNAPHIPVHLGSMSKAVEFQIETLGGEIKPGDVYLTNHPCAGGTHLPDLTVITPVFIDGQDRPIFFVASRGHHADIGGLTPGSMPSNSTSLNQEGAQFVSFKLVSQGEFREKELVELFMAPGAYPGCSGSRTLNDNLADLRAQIAANQRGVQLVNDLIQGYTLPVVLAYMGHIQKNAELEVRDLLKEIAAEKGAHIEAEDFMDDGTRIKLTIQIDPNTGSAVFDFTGTGEQVYGNCNAPRSVVYSAIIYCLRCLVGHEMPLNHGALAPITVIFPENSIISPSFKAAVVGGNVLTSQRLTDIVLRAFEACAASQGCMNNTTFGDSSCGYYETVAGGAGATSKSDGRSGVHTHMTNTRMTDVEILEKRYPVVLKQFTLNAGTGGSGVHRGGDGTIRELLFRKPLTLSVLTERRVFAPYGLKGGGPGARGKNLILRHDGEVMNLGSKNTIEVGPGDCFRLETPGGGGWGAP